MLDIDSVKIWLRKSILLLLILQGMLPVRGHATEAPSDLVALNRQLRIDLTWQGEGYNDSVYQVRRGEAATGPFDILPDSSTFPIFSDFTGRPNQTFFYSVREAKYDGEKLLPTSPWSDPVRGMTLKFDRVALIDEVQEASLRIATVGSHPRSGLVSEWITTRGKPKRAEWKVAASGATGMTLTNFVVAAERGYLDRKNAAEAVLKALRFLGQKAERFHGAFSHWIDHETGQALPFSKFDDGGDIVETALLMQGVLIVREYFSRQTQMESEIRKLANRLWREVEWNWYQKDGGDRLLWHWSPKHGWKMNLPVQGFCEAEILYLLGIASPTHSIPVSCYYNGWRGAYFGKKRNHFGIPLELGQGLGGCTFWYYYSHIGIDPNTMQYRGRSYLEHFRDHCAVQLRFIRSQSKYYKGYDEMWGLTAAPGPDGYVGFKPGKLNNGTLVPAASLSAYLYAPEASQKSLDAMYLKHGQKIWQEFGFIESFNLTRDWQFPTYLGIDAGPVAAMLENYRTGLLWELFMNAPEIRNAMKRIKADSRWNK